MEPVSRRCAELRDHNFIWLRIGIDRVGGPVRPAHTAIKRRRHLVLYVVLIVLVVILVLPSGGVLASPAMRTRTSST
jgi:hypothetical protein